MKINPEYALPRNNDIKPSTSNNEETNVSVFNDKNGNGVVDKDDFSNEEFEKLENNGLYRLFDGKKWTDNLKKIFTSIMNGGNPNGDVITEQYPGTMGTEKHVLYDGKTNTLKIAGKNPNTKEYFSYQEEKYNNAGQNIEQKRLLTSPKYQKDGHKYSFMGKNTDIYVRTQGFENNNLSTEDANLVNKLIEDNKEFFFMKSSNKYDKNGNNTETIANFPLDELEGREEVIIKNGETITIKYDRDNNFISKTKSLKDVDKYNDDGTSHSEHLSETYDKDNNLQYRTTIINDYLGETVKTDIDGNEYDAAIIKNIATREYTNGNIYNETNDGETIKAELKDKNGNILEKYTLQYNNNLKSFEKVFEDGSHKKADFEPLTD